MDARRLAQRIAMSRGAPTGVLGALALAAIWLPSAYKLLGLSLLALAAIAWTTWLGDALRAILRRAATIDGEAKGSPAARVARAFEWLEIQLDSLQHRTLQVHPVSGLPLREALTATIEQARSGLLGVIALKDVDRLCAFDPGLADRLVVRCAERLQAMLRGSRFLAQIDRGHIGIWFGERMDEGEALAQLDAVAYALGSEVSDGGTQIIPQIATRLIAYRAQADIRPQAFIAQALASFALPQRDPGAPIAPAEDDKGLARARFTLEQDLRQAIDRRELHLLYQPLIDAELGQVDGAEALLRWEHPEQGPITPAAFIPVLEEIGLADEIGAWALNTAIREAQHWEASGLPPMRVAVNVSALQLEGDELPRFAERALTHHGLSAERLEIELTESVATSDAAHCRDVFAKLRDMGVKLAVDDFGTGYSGFSSLRRLAFDKIKIDREFVTQVHLRRDCQAICQSIIALGRGLGIRVLAEGIEEVEEYAWLKQQGCRYFQGYFFARPLTPEDFAAFVRDEAGLARLLAGSATREKVTA